MVTLAGASSSVCECRLAASTRGISSNTPPVPDDGCPSCPAAAPHTQSVSPITRAQELLLRLVITSSSDRRDALLASRDFSRTNASGMGFLYTGLGPEGRDENDEKRCNVRIRRVIFVLLVWTGMSTFVVVSRAQSPA